DHSIVNDGGYNLQITGNTHENSSEPGIVWVMQDSNGNGLPDDTWYELRGSEHSNNRTTRSYAVTYFRQRETGRPVYWTDNEGSTGTIDYLGSFHSQDSYYPLWIDRDYYTLTGTRLESRNYLSPTGSWISPAYDWGYADNNEQDLFRIADAVTPKGEPVEMDFIDFVKVQTGVQGKSGWLGEISTEICSISDYNLIK
ncbi:MAG: cell surface protein, partial [Bacteroidales bacterium]|nr:cell surface protein [Bacteroidales bacterium]